eukprot:3306501-Lingulodinium_polyedra.AAC.1
MVHGCLQVPLFEPVFVARSWQGCVGACRCSVLSAVVLRGRACQVFAGMSRGVRAFAGVCSCLDGSLWLVAPRVCRVQ